MCFGPRPWHIEIRHRVTHTSTIYLFGFETLKLKIRRLKLWKPTVHLAVQFLRKFSGDLRRVSFSRGCFAGSVSRSCAEFCGVLRSFAGSVFQRVSRGVSRSFLRPVRLPTGVAEVRGRRIREQFIIILFVLMPRHLILIIILKFLFSYSNQQALRRFVDGGSAKTL